MPSWITSCRSTWEGRLNRLAIMRTSPMLASMKRRRARLASSMAASSDTEP